MISITDQYVTNSNIRMIEGCLIIQQEHFILSHYYDKFHDRIETFSTLLLNKDILHK